jgi:protein-disulfide isomerase
MLKISMLAGILMSCAVTLASTPSQADLDAGERAEIQREIESYIKANPEILRDALMALAAREEADRRRAGLMLVRDDAGDPVMGNPDGTVTIYEFSDYNCGYCKRMFGTVQDLLKKNADLRMVLKEFPILSQSSLTAARAGIAAQKQGKFAPFHVAMMTHRGQVNDASIMKAAQEAEIDLASFQRDMASDETARIIERTRAAARALGLNGTPAFVIGDTIIPGAVDAKQLQAVIDDVRTKQR